MTSAPESAVRARRVGEVRVIIRQRSARHRRADVGDAPVDELLDGGSGVGPGGALADEDEGPLGRLEQVGDALDGRRIRVGSRDLRRRAERRLDSRFGDAPGHDLAGEIEVDAARPALLRLAEREVDPLSDALGGVDAPRPLADRARGRDLIELLEATQAGGARERRAAEHHQGHGALGSDVERRDAVRDRWPRARHQHAGLALLPAPGHPHEACVDLVAAAHDLHALALATGEDLDHRAGHDAEERVDSGSYELSSGELSTVDISHRSLRLGAVGRGREWQERQATPSGALEGVGDSGWRVGSPGGDQKVHSNS